jgi:hypothetical protein
MTEIRTGILHECDVRRAIKQHLLDCLKRPEYYNYPHEDLVADYTKKIKDIDEFLEKFDK